MAVETARDDRVAEVRAFNRFYTNVIGLLGEGMLRTPYSLTEARVIFELGRSEAAEIAEVRRVLELDAGYLSRINARFEADGILTRERSPQDGRKQVVRLTDGGRAAFELLDERSAAEVQALLSGLSEADQRRLVAAMGAIHGVLDDPGPQPFVVRPPLPGDLGWVVQSHGVVYAQEHGWDESFEGLVAAIVAGYVNDRDPKRERAWIAEVDGRPAGCVFCVEREEDVAQLRLLLVDPSARGMGIGTRLVDECMSFARTVGYERMMLWTQSVLEDARRIYERADFELVDAKPHRSFGHDLVGQDWWRTL